MCEYRSRTKTHVKIPNGLNVEQADVGHECVGYQCHDPAGKEVPNLTMNNLVQSVKFTRGIGVVGVFTPQDPGASDDLAKKGEIAFDWGMCWFKGQHIATGQCNVKAYNRQLRDLIHAGRAKPSFIVSHEIELSKAREAYSTSTRATTAGRK